MYQIKFYQKLPLSLEAAWDFFSKPSNLRLLTPEYLQFEITSNQESSKMYPGQIISYVIRPFANIGLEWITEITHVKEFEYFIDEQRFGPYKFWHHEHHFKSILDGVEMIDIVYYKMPLGLVGHFLHFLKVKKDLQGIFSYRKAKLENLFGSL